MFANTTMQRPFGSHQSHVLVDPQQEQYIELNLDFPKLRQVHEKPPIFLCDDFLSYEQCDHLIRVATPLLKRSQIHAIAGVLAH